MFLFRALIILLLAAPAWAVEGYIIGGGLESDSADGYAASIIGELKIADETWLSAAIAKSTAELPRDLTLDTVFGDVGIDHWFKPVGISASLAYWGDHNILDSVNYRASVYWRSAKVRISGDVEYRDFELDFPATDRFPVRKTTFGATGFGLSTRFKLSDRTDLSIYGMNYEYDVNFRLDENDRIRELLSVSRLSLLNSLVDYRVGASLSLDVGKRQWQLELATWQGEADQEITKSATIRFITPLGQASDIEFGLGIDKSDVYGNTTFLSVFMYFYGGS
ncbi:MAG: hypothetical protein IH910_01080 [Proteobacteria bacterium]|nr:hypothetical protein [Pseudomonadota bacterium]